VHRTSGHAIAAALAGLCVVWPSPARAANQTADLSPVVIGATLPFSAQIGAPVSFGDHTLQSLHSFVKASYYDPAAGHSQWLVLGGMTNGMHDLTGLTGFDPASHNTDVTVIDPVTRQVWSRSLSSDDTGLTTLQLASLATTNAQFTQKGSRLYVAGGYGHVTLPNGDIEYQTFTQLTSIDLPGMIDWVKGGSGTAANRLRQISDPMFQVTGGEMATTSNGRTHLVFGQNYPTSYEPRQNGEYTKQIRSFTIVDDGVNLSVSNPLASAVQEDFRRRDLNVVPVIRRENGQLVEKLQALAGVFTPSFGAWTVPVTIDANGAATQPNPAAAGTFKQGMNGYRTATLGLYSATADTMHTLLLGGISYQYFDPASGEVLNDFNLPFVSDATDIVTDADGRMTQHLLPSSFPAIPSANTGQPLLLGTETEFFLKDGIATYSNGVIDLDALAGPTLVGWLYGGIAADLPNNGPTVASNAVFPVIITPGIVPEPLALCSLLVPVALIRPRRHRA
jgi:hypothetical protein